MKRVAGYLLVVLILDLIGMIWIWLGSGLALADGLKPILQCALVGCLGGTVYCMRATYVNYSAKQTWDDKWQPWYYLRPIVSFVTGGVSWLFVNAGLLMLDASVQQGQGHIGFLAFAFVAGYNVDNFFKKVEDTARSVWGIGVSRSSKE